MMKRNRSDSIKAMVQAAQNAALGPIEAPEYMTLPEAVKPYWRALMVNRPRDRWNEFDLTQAAVMARAQADIERLQAEIEAEGDLVDEKINPKHKLVEMLQKRVMALATALRVNPAATVGRSQNQGKALELERAAKAATVSPLIPRMKVVG